VRLVPIGKIYSPFQRAQNTPIQPFQSRAVGRVEVFDRYREGLCDIEGFSHLILLYRFHQAKRGRLKVRPFLDDEERGVFATRYPGRPNRLGLSVVRLIKRRGRVLWVKGIDVINGTPLLDIKPYVSDFDHYRKAAVGWLRKKIR
jgi:tRNA-Thr(GGU) m(6)t(6)A37 methyltransferase TsaA